MTTINSKDARLFSLYTRYVGEPESRKDVYGYWLFLLGCTVSFIGVLVYQVGPTELSSPFVYQTREVSTTLAGIGLPLGLLGIVLMLPVKRKAMISAVIGALLALAGVVWFTQVYPSNWVITTPDYSQQVIAVYTSGVAIVAAVAALVPVVTGEQSFYFGLEDQRAEEYPEVMVGQSRHGASVAVYKADGEWTWRLIEQNALAGDAGSYLSRLETEEQVEVVQSKIGQAGLIEIKHAAFRLYEADDGQWRWMLMREDGSVVANSGGEFDTRDRAAESVSVCKESSPEAAVIGIEGAAFDIYDDRGDWYWRLIDEDRNVLATAATAYADRSAATDPIDDVRDQADGAAVLSIDQYGVELYEAKDGWRWRLMDAERNVVATAATEYGSRRTAETAVYDMLEDVVDAPLVDASVPAYVLSETPSEAWEWRLLDPDGDLLARSRDEAESPEAAAESATQLKTSAEDAEVVAVEDAAFELFRDGTDWRWRLVTETRDVIAESIPTFASRDAVSEGVKTAAEQALAAELIDFETAAFQIYETNEEWRWRLIDEDGNVLTDSGEEHGSRDSAAKSMLTVKEMAPEADLLEIETSAFELFHDDEDNWNWRLVDEGGETLAQGGSMQPSRDAAREAMDRLLEHSEGTDSRVMAQPEFQLYADDEWWWRYVRPDGTVIAESPVGYATRSEAETAIENDVRHAAHVGRVNDVGSLSVHLLPVGDGEWRWELVEDDDFTLAESVDALTRAEIESTFADLKRHTEDVTVFELQGPTYLVSNRGGTWRWDLIDEDRTLIAEGVQAPTEKLATAAVDLVRDRLPDAGVLDYDDVAFDVYDDGDDWRWRLIDGDETIIAVGAVGYDSRSAAESAIETIVGDIDDASILEIDSAAFELNEDDGQWTWRLIGDDGRELGASLRSYPTHREAREAMSIVKEFGADAMVQVAE